MNYLSPADLIAIHELLIAEFGGMRGITEAGFGRLEAAAAAPQLSMFGEDIYASAVDKAAALCLAIVRGHPFSDGNKRVALVALDMVLERHGGALTATDEQAYEVIMALARGELGQAALVEWIKQHTGVTIDD